MNLVSENSTADDGTRVQSVVNLSIEDIGVAKLPFCVRVSVDYARMFVSHHATEAEAKKERERMHAAYLEVHASPAL
jgi:hypothetical protein